MFKRRVRGYLEVTHKLVHDRFYDRPLVVKLDSRVTMRRDQKNMT